MHERFPVSVPQRFKGRALILKMLVIESLTANMHVVNALHTKNFSLAQSNNAFATDVKVAVTATFELYHQGNRHRGDGSPCVPDTHEFHERYWVLLERCAPRH